MRLALVVVLALAACAPGAWARPVTEQEKAALAATVESFNAAMRAADYARIVQTIPPKVLGAFARRAGVPPDQIVASVIQQMQQAFQGGGVRIEAFRMDLDGAEHRQLAGGAPYLLIPTETIIAVNGKRLRARSPTLALLDDGQWFLLRISDAPYLQILFEVYPEFAGVEFPRGSMEAMNP